MNYEQLSTEQVNRMSGNLDTLTSLEYVALMDRIDADVLTAVAQAGAGIAAAIDAIAERMRGGGRLIYMGAGTSGRLGVLDASECPPTFGVSPDLVVGIIAGGDRALRYAVEGAEDRAGLAEADLKRIDLCARDSVIAISASGTARYCFGALDYARSVGALPVCMVCNENAPLIARADIAVVMPTGAEALSGSTRLKAGTATKLALNRISTGVMIRLGKVYRNLMVDMTPTNTKLKDRALRIIMQAVECDRAAAEALYAAADGSAKAAIVMGLTGRPLPEASDALRAHEGRVREASESLTR